MKNKDTLIENVAAAKELRRVPEIPPQGHLRHRREGDEAGPGL